MRFCLMLLNGGQFDGVRLLKKETVRLMTTDKLNCLPKENRPAEFGLGFGILPDSDDVHTQLRRSYAWGGYWSTCFRISPKGDWVLIAMAQVAWQKKVTPAWISHFEQTAADSVADQVVIREQ
jgi:CubicO group peptidase (beta-lactamase class C family)